MAGKTVCMPCNPAAVLLPCYPTSSTLGSYTIPCVAEQLCITQHAYSSRSGVELLLLKGLQPEY